MEDSSHQHQVFSRVLLFALRGAMEDSNRRHHVVVVLSSRVLFELREAMEDSSRRHHVVEVARSSSNNSFEIKGAMEDSSRQPPPCRQGGVLDSLNQMTREAVTD